MEKNLKDLYFVSVYYSFDCDSPLYVFSTEEEAVAVLPKVSLHLTATPLLKELWEI